MIAHVSVFTGLLIITLIPFSVVSIETCEEVVVASNVSPSFTGIMISALFKYSEANNDFISPCLKYELIVPGDSITSSTCKSYHY